jgi:hypothetical protein
MKPFNRKKTRTKQKAKEKASLQDPTRRDEEIRRSEYNWMDEQNSKGGPSNPDAIPVDKHISDMPDETVGWVRSICKFSQST